MLLEDQVPAAAVLLVNREGVFPISGKPW